MILIPNDGKPQTIGNLNYTKYAKKFNIYYQPAVWTDNGSTEPDAGYELENLSSDVYSEHCVWGGEGDVRIAGIFGGVKKIDTVIFGNPGWNEFRGVFYNGGNVVFKTGSVFWSTENGVYVKHKTGRIIFNHYSDDKAPLCRKLAPREEKLDVTDQNIIIIPLYIEADSFAFDFDGPGRLNKLYLGRETRVAAPHDISYGYKGNANGGITDYGVVYGAKYPPTRTFGASWDLMDDTDRRALERYMLDVQTVVPHYIAPVPEYYYIPPMFAALANDALNNKKRAQSWHWEGFDLSWTEVN
jgi:hypothetical protein